MKKRDKFATELEEVKQEKKRPNKKYQYRNGKKEITSFTLDPEIIDKIERVSYHFGKNKSEVANSILHKFFDDKDFDPIPEQKDFLE